MTEKIEISARLGEQGILLPSLLGKALQANDRIKLRFSLLQEALAQARNPCQPRPTFAAERHAAGLDDTLFDATISGARALTSNQALVPGSTALLSGVRTDLAAMLAPIETADPGDAKSFSSRLAVLTTSIPTPDDDTISSGDIAPMTSARRDATDSVHLLVMDMHQAINRLVAATAPETIDGAKAHGAESEDRPRIKAFMNGVNRTKALAFGHPGLGTTAVRTGARLTIQNDIGTTDAHVLVVHVEGQDVTVTYTDVHRPRAKFFISLFEGHMVNWGSLAERDAQGLGEDEVFYLLTGWFKADNQASLTLFLEFLGSRIVFLIDWNKARKALQTFVGRNGAIGLLAWAAAHEHGHRAFLELGGVDLIFEAIRRVAEGRIPYGARLDNALGAAETEDFLRTVLQQTSRGLLAGRSARLIRDEIQADLSQRFETGETTLFMVVLRHLGLSRMLAGWLYDTLSIGDIAPAEDRQRIASRAKKLEEKGDRLTLSARELAVRLHDSGKLRRLIDSAEDALDTLDECAFLLSLVPETEAADALAVPLAGLSRLTVESVSHLVRAVEAAAQLPSGLRADARDSLRFIDAVLNVEHRADAAQRDVMSACVGAASSDARSLVLGLELARTLETATDHLAHAAFSLRDRMLEELSA
jgi:uncharacterized protein Yka (UPF0111/DUF47 family)